MRKNTKVDMGKLYDVISSSVEKTVSSAMDEGVEKGTPSSININVKNVNVTGLDEGIEQSVKKRKTKVKTKIDVDVEADKIDYSKIEDRLDELYNLGSKGLSSKKSKEFRDLVYTLKKHKKEVKREYLEFAQIMQDTSEKLTSSGKVKEKYARYQPKDISDEYIKDQIKSQNQVKDASTNANNAIIRSQDDVQEEINETIKTITREKETLKSLEGLLNESPDYTGQKRKATDSLRFWNNKINSEDSANDSQVISYMKTFKAAESAEVAQSSLDRYFNAEAFGRYKRSFKNIQHQVKITSDSINLLEQKLDKLNEEVKTAPKISQGDKALLNLIDNLDKTETESDEAKKSIKEALEISSKQDAGSGVEALALAYDELDTAARRATDSIEKLWIRSEGGSYSNKYLTQALNDYTSETTKTHTDQKGNEVTTSTWAIHYDKLKNDVLKIDKEILELEYKINHAQGDTSGSQEKLQILKEQRLAIFDVLDAAINDPLYEVTNSQKELLNATRQTEQAKILAEQRDRESLQITKAQISAENDRLKITEKQNKEELKIAETQKKEIQKRNNQLKKQSAQQQSIKEKEDAQKLQGLLSDQEQAYRKIWDIRKQISKLNPDKDTNRISSLEQEKKIQLDIYSEKTKEIKKIDEQANAEAQVNNLLNIRKQAISEISIIQAKNSDKQIEAQRKAEQQAIITEQKRADEAVENANKEALARTKARQLLQNKAEKEFIQRGTSHNQEAIKEYQALINSAERYYQLRKSESNNTLTENEKIELNNLTAQFIKATNAQDEYSVATNGSAESLKRLQNIQSIFNNQFSESSQVAIRVSQDLRDMQANLEKLADSGKYTSKLSSDLLELAQRIEIINSNPIDLRADKVIEEIARIEAEEAKLIERTKAADEKLASADTIAKLNLKIEEFIQKNSKMGSVFRQQFEKLKIDWDAEETIRGVKDLATQFHKLESEVYAADKAGKSFFATLGGRIKQMSTNFIAMYFSLYDIVRYVREAVGTIRELDDALIDLRKTTTMSNEELNSFYYDANDVAKQMGTSTKEIISQAAAWSRLGYQSKEAATEMAALSSQFAAISPGMDLDKATDGLVSTMKAFNIDVANVERDVMDNVNRIGNTMATSNEEIVEMLTRSSAAMNAANNSIEETIALESAAVQITRNAETTGTAFRTDFCPYVQQCA